MTAEERTAMSDLRREAEELYRLIDTLSPYEAIHEIVKFGDRKRGIGEEAGRLEGLREAAQHCRESDVPLPIDAFMGTKKEFGAALALALAVEIEAKIAEGGNK